MANRIGDADMGDATLVEKGFGPLEGAIDELIDNNEFARVHVFAQAATCRQGDDFGNANALQGTNICPVGNIAGRMNMSTAMARQKGDVDAVQAACENLVRRRAERRIHRYPLSILDTVNLVDSGSADDAKFNLFH